MGPTGCCGAPRGGSPTSAAPSGSGARSPFSKLGAVAAQGVRGLAWGILALQLAGGALLAAHRAVEWLVQAREERKLGYNASRERALGFYALWLEEAERRIPPDGSYILINDDEGGAYMGIQGDLAPRRALALGGREPLPPRLWTEQEAPADLPLLVVVFHGFAYFPTTLPTEEYLAQWPREP